MEFRKMVMTSLCARLGFPSSSDVKHLPTMREIWVRSLGREDPPEKAMATHSSGNPLLPGKSHGPRSLIVYSPWGHKESDMTERLHFTSLPVQDSKRDADIKNSLLDSVGETKGGMI